MITTYVLLLYLTTPSANSGMTTATAEYTSQAKCEAAGEAAKKSFGGWATTVRWSCSPK